MNSIRTTFLALFASSALTVRRLAWAALTAFTCLSGQSQAMSFNHAPPVLYLGGSVVPDDWQAWQEAMQRFSPQIDTIVLHDSGGGDSRAGRDIGTDIRRRKLRTVVDGRCSSACANMFLGGSVRQFALTHGKVTAVLGYHGSYNKRTHAVNVKKSGDYFLDMTEGKMDAEFVERFIHLENQKGMMRFFHPVQRGKPDDPLVMLCLGDEDRLQRYEQCERLPDIDALSKGVVTTWGVYEFAPPPSVSRKRATFKSWASQAQPPTEPPPTLPAGSTSEK
jgi:hypothetical protein